MTSLSVRGGHCGESGPPGPLLRRNRVKHNLKIRRVDSFKGTKFICTFVEVTHEMTKLVFEPSTHQQRDGNGEEDIVLTEVEIL